EAGEYAQERIEGEDLDDALEAVLGGQRDRRAVAVERLGDDRRHDARDDDRRERTDRERAEDLLECEERTRERRIERRGYACRRTRRDHDAHAVRTETEELPHER